MTEIAVDPSAIFALVLGEPDAEVFRMALADCRPVMSLPSRIELAHGVLRKLGADAVAEVEAMLEDYEFRFEPFDARQAETAIAGLLKFGRGRGKEPAVLNLGDAFSYALSRTMGLPLLYKGEDFSRTDVISALRASPGD
jgi:ribonuclease VapC